MRILLSTAVVILLWLLSGCMFSGDSGSGDDAGAGAAKDETAIAAAGLNEETTAEGGGEIITDFAQNESTITLTGELPPDWPVELQLYPDSTLGETTVTDLPEGKTFSAKLKTQAAPADVLKFHESQTISVNGHIAESTLGPDHCFGTYYCPTYAMVLTVDRAEATEITMAVNPPASPDQQLQAIRQLVDQDAVPEGFPTDLIPRYPGSRIVNGFFDGLGFYSIEMLTTDDIATAADYYREHFAGLGWEEYSPLEKDIVRVYAFRGSAGKLMLNVSSGGDAENHISISYDENK